MRVAVADGILKAGHAETCVHEVYKRKDDGAKRNGNADAQKVFEYGSGAFRNVGLGHGIKSVVAHFVHYHVQQRCQRAYGNAEDGARDHLGLIVTGFYEVGSQCKSRGDLCQHLEDLAYGGRGHVLIALS